MNDGAKQAYLDKMAAQIKEWGAKVEVLEAKAAKGAAGVRVDYHNQLESWRKQETVLQQKMEELRAAGADKFEILKSGVQNVWVEINKLLETTKEETK